MRHESALWSAGKWHPADGYGFPPSNAPSNTARSVIKVLKLHGSANWEQKSEHDITPEIAAQTVFFEGSHDTPTGLAAGTGWHEGRYLITPTYLKDISSNPLLLQLWHDATTAIAEASAITVIGYRLHPADALARYM